MVSACNSSIQRLGQEDCEFVATLGYVEILPPPKKYK